MVLSDHGFLRAVPVVFGVLNIAGWETPDCQVDPSCKAGKSGFSANSRYSDDAGRLKFLATAN